MNLSTNDEKEVIPKVMTKEEIETIKKQIKDLNSQLPKPPRKARKLPTAINEEEFTSLLKATKRERNRICFLLGFASGMRVSEMVNLQPERINLKERTIFISQGKGKKDRIVPLPKGFRENHIHYFPMKFKNLKSGIRCLEIAFKNSARKAGLLETKPTLHIHSLRHGFASQAVSNGVPIHHVRTLMGHANIQTTNVYLELNPKEALKSYEELF